MNKKESMNIVFAPDDNYVMPTSVAITSLLENNIQNIIIYILYIEGHLANESRAILKSVTNKYNIEIIFKSVEPNLFKGYPKLRHGLSTYLRLFVPKLFPELDKMLYLDGDIVINGDVSHFYNSNIENYQLAGVADSLTLNTKYLSSINYNFDRPYINAGIILMNLKRLRTIDITSSTIDYINKNREFMKYNDQDIINNIFPDILIVEPKYNAQHYVWSYNKIYGKQLQPREALEEARRSPIIVHYITPIKPWHFECAHCCKKMWYDYLSQTQFIGYKPTVTLGKIITLSKSKLRRLLAFVYSKII